MKKITNNHYENNGTIKKPDFDTQYLEPKIEKLGKLLNSKKLASDLFYKITSGVSSKTYIRYHIRLAIDLIQYHNNKCHLPPLGLSSFQSSLTDYINDIQRKQEKIDIAFYSILKKIYFFFEKREYFHSDELSDNFNIYELCPENGGEILRKHFKRLEQYSKNIDITQTTEQFLSSKNVIKNYVRCYADVFENITKIDPDWTPTAIRLGIEEYRDHFNTDTGSLNTKYHETGRVLELFNYLKTIGLIDKKTVLPRNIKKPAYSSLMRNTNPTFSVINVDSLSIEESMSSAKVLIDNFYNDLIKKLDCLISAAKKVVTDFYNQFSQRGAFPSDGMSSELISAMHVVIIDEMGLNPTSLYNLRVSTKPGIRNKKEFIKVDDDGTVRINIIKWRQRYLQKRTTSSVATLKDQTLQQQDVNASFCIQFAIVLTDEKRNALNTNLLWIRKGQKVVRTSNAFDQDFRDFCNTHLPSDFAKLKPTLMKLRSSRAIEIYINSNGDIIKTATYLGNKVKTTLSAYIPLYLQEVMYRRKLSVFQHIYLLLATAHESKKHEMLGITEIQYNNCVKRIYNNDDFGGPLFESLKPKFDDKTDDNVTEIFFICSPQNFAYAIKVVKSSNDKTDEKYKVCLDAINKASSGSTIFKRMILEAENILESEVIDNE